MIVKKIPNPKTPSPKATRIGGLLDYIEAKNDEKLELRFAIGDFLTGSWQGQRAEMIALAGEARRSKNPIDHWLLSWKAGEQPSVAECREAVEVLKRHLGMSSDHQAICALHSNTENLHLHIVVNRTHPETFRVADNGWSVDRAHQALSEIVQRQGWEHETNAVYRAVKDGKRGDKAISAPHTKARDFENATGAKSAERLAMEEVPKLIHAAQSWSDVHSALSARRIRYEQKGSGALVWVGDTAVKASAIGREFSRKRMEERFGPFESAGEKAAASPSERVLKPLCAEAGSRWTEYRTFLNTYRLEKDQAQRELRISQRSEREEQGATFRGERKDLYTGGRWRGDSLNVARSLMAADQARRKAALISEHEAERDAARKRLGVRPVYEQFLRAADQHQLADHWRYRNASPEVASLSGDGPGEATPRDIRDFAARIEYGVSKRETFIGYFAQARPETLSFADRGKQIDIYQSTNRAAVLAALQVASQKWGILTVTGLAEFQILCAELAQEHGFQIQNLPVISAETQQERAAPQPADQTLPSSPYDVHRRDILGKISVQNPSQLDWMIAVRMRATGYDQKEITQELLRHIGAERISESRDWDRYAQRTAEAVFGPRGDREVFSHRGREASWRQLEDQAFPERTPKRGPDRPVAELRLQSQIASADLER